MNWTLHDRGNPLLTADDEILIVIQWERVEGSGGRGGVGHGERAYD